MVFIGTDNNNFSKEIITGRSSYNQRLSIPEMPKQNHLGHLVMHNDTILLCGGKFEQKCFQLTNGTWKYHSTLNEGRGLASIVSTNTTTFIFGGFFSQTTFEYLPKNSNTWILGKNEIPKMHMDGCAIAVKSEQEIWLIGGYDFSNAKTFTSREVIRFSVNDHTFEKLPLKLNIGRQGPRCAFIPGTNKIIITGGRGRRVNGLVNGNLYLKSSELLDIENESIEMASPLNMKRFHHGIGVITINDEEKLVVVGGEYRLYQDSGMGFHRSVEIYDKETQMWKIANLKLKKPKGGYGYLSVKLGILGEIIGGNTD